MKQVILITSNKEKFREFKDFLPTLVQKELDLPEFQTLDSTQLIKEKIIHAKTIINDDVLVEDTSLTLNCLNELPGPFIKFFEKSIGLDGLYELCSKYDDYKAIAITKIGYSKGNSIAYFEGILEGTICQPRGVDGFGWDKIFIPKDYDKTFAEMASDAKMQISMRSIALSKLVNYLHINV